MPARPPPNAEILEQVKNALRDAPDRGFGLILCSGNARGTLAQLGEALAGGEIRVVAISLAPSTVEEAEERLRSVLPRDIAGAILGLAGSLAVAARWLAIVTALVSAGQLGWVTVQAILERLDRNDPSSPVELVERCLAAVVRRVRRLS